MWSRAAWYEGKKQVEGVVPSSWIKDKSVVWPPVYNAKRYIVERRSPGPNWKHFSLIKIKYTSG